MKLLDSYTNLIYRIYFPIILLAGFCAFFFSRYLSYALILSNIFVIFVLFLLLSPVSKIRLKNISGYSKVKALIFIVLIQLAFIAIFITVFNTFITSFSLVTSQGNFSLSHSWENMLKNSLNWYLFPWSTASLLAIIIAYKNKSEITTLPFLATLSYILRTPQKGTLAMGAEIFTRQGMIFFVSSILVSLCLTIYYWFCAIFKLAPIAIGGIETLLLSGSIYFLLNLGWFEKVIYQSWRKNITSARLLLLQTLILILFITVLTPMARETVRFFSGMKVSLLQSIPAPDKWQLFVWSWWLTSIPFMASFMARYLEAITIRTALIFMLVLPIFSYVLLIIYYFYFLNSVTGLFTSAHPILLIFSTLISLGLIVYYLFFTHDFDHKIKGTFYKNHTLKQKLPIKIVFSILQNMILLLLIYLLGGLVSFSIYYFAMNITCIVVFGAIISGFCFQKKSL